MLAADGRFESVEGRPDGVVLRLGGQPASAAVAALVGAGLAVDQVVPHRRLEDAFLALISGVPDGAAGDGTGLDAVADLTPADVTGASAGEAAP